MYKFLLFLFLWCLQAFCSILKLDAMVNFKAKGNCLVFVLACHAMMAAYSAEDNWPDSFVKVSPSIIPSYVVISICCHMPYFRCEVAFLSVISENL